MAQSRKKVEEQLTYVIKSLQFRAQEYVYLGTHAMVFQSEITAINMICLMLLDKSTTGKQIDFYLDSQSTIRVP